MQKCNFELSFFIYVPYLQKNTIFISGSLKGFFCLFYTVAEVDGNTYWRYPFSSLCNPRQLEEFIVMDMDIIRDQKLGAGAGVRSNKVSLDGQNSFSVGSSG